MEEARCCQLCRISVIEPVLAAAIGVANGGGRRGTKGSVAVLPWSSTSWACHRRVWVAVAPPFVAALSPLKLHVAALTAGNHRWNSIFSLLRHHWSCCCSVFSVNRKSAVSVAAKVDKAEVTVAAVAGRGKRGF
ncbi:uncharacterized protein DS421_19g660930 [Arachis hypogaea]|uniref:Uncharacterized protein n=1 Tax=Arachis hypogaea TaxID=3818 RepID=A0A6B9VBQ2_ARAHY|nr:uncharacterized protein DS421_19g660930 [Arachis hypogaea]